MLIPQPHPKHRIHRERGHRSNCNSEADHDANALRCSDANLGTRAGYVPLVEPDAHADSHATPDSDLHAHADAYRDPNTNPNARPL